jgi:hypothetical protein
MLDLLDSMLSMTLDVYTQSNTQDVDTGNIKREWNYAKTIACTARPNISSSVRSSGYDSQKFNTKYFNGMSIEARTVDKLGLRQKVTNICDSSNTPIYVEEDYPSSTPTVFEVISSKPMMDAFGSIIAYDSVLQRSENQLIGL